MNKYGRLVERVVTITGYNLPIHLDLCGYNQDGICLEPTISPALHLTLLANIWSPSSAACAWLIMVMASFENITRTD